MDSLGKYRAETGTGKHCTCYTWVPSASQMWFIRILRVLSAETYALSQGLGVSE